jgi:hypothetical protein
MKRFLPIALVCAAPLFAQQAQPPAVTIEDLKTPPSPAFVLMGIAPTSVERPTTPRALGMAFVNAVEQESGTLPQNFAVEVAPYWLTPRPDLTFDQYDRAGFWQGLQQTFSTSLATKGSEDGATATPAGTLIGAGARASWMIGKRSELAEQVIAAYRTKAADMLAAAGPPVPGQPATAGLPADFDAQLRPFVASMRDALRQGRWVIESAAALTGRFPDNDTSHGQTEKAAIWITPAYRFVRSTFDSSSGTLTQVPTVDFIAVARYIHDRTVATDGDGIDLGARLLWESALFALSAEHVQRLNIAEPTHRTTVMVEYKISDNLYLSGTFGKDFDDPSTEQGDLQAILGVNLNLGQKPKLVGLPVQ